MCVCFFHILFIVCCYSAHRRLICLEKIREEEKYMGKYMGEDVRIELLEQFMLHHTLSL